MSIPLIQLIPVLWSFLLCVLKLGTKTLVLGKAVCLYPHTIPKLCDKTLYYSYVPMNYIMLQFTYAYIYLCLEVV